MVVIGKTGSPWGIHGWLKVLSYTEQAEGLLAWPEWFLQRNGCWELARIAEGRQYGRGVAVRLEGCTTPEQAALFRGCLVGIPRTSLPETDKDEYYWTDLEGLTVIDQHDKPLGTVVSLMATGSNDVMIVRTTDGKQTALPWLPGSVITRVDLANGKIRVNWDPL